MKTNLTGDKLKRAALLYHRQGRNGKIEVQPSKPFNTQRDLSLAYTPGVAAPCLEIVKDKSNAALYTDRSNLVGVITNGSAVLGLGNIGALAGKPVMEGKSNLFKKFADIDVFDIELDISDPDEFINVVKTMEPTFGGINLEDIKAPECFYIEEKLRELMDIPVFHDDQHGTAIISGAGLINGLLLVDKKIDQVKIVISGAGAAGIASARFYEALGAKREHIFMVDSKGVMWKGRGDEEKNPYKTPYFHNTEARTLSDVIRGADVFAGFSVKGILSKEMVKMMNENPLIFALANPDPEISYEDAREARPDAIVATGRSDYPNQINNVLGFPYIFRGALDVMSKTINMEMQLAAAHALAELARQEVPQIVKRIYENKELSFGPEYIIPKPFDPRVLSTTASAIAEAAMKTNVAGHIIDIEAYRERLRAKTDWTRGTMRNIYNTARKHLRTLIFPEGDHPSIKWAASQIIEEKLANPVLLVKDVEKAKAEFKELGHDVTGIKLLEYRNASFKQELTDAYYTLRQRRGVTWQQAQEDTSNRYIFAYMMVRLGYGHGVVAGIDTDYPFVLKSALQILGPPSGEVVSGIHWVRYKNKSVFMTDTAVNIDPGVDALTSIVSNGISAVQRFGFTPRVAMLSYSNFGAVRGEETLKIEEVMKRIKKCFPHISIDGPMQANYALDPELLHKHYSFTTMEQRPNLLVFPDLSSANISVKILEKMLNANMIGPIMEGFSHPVQLLTRSSSVRNIVNLAALCVVEAFQSTRQVKEHCM